MKYRLVLSVFVLLFLTAIIHSLAATPGDCRAPADGLYTQVVEFAWVNQEEIEQPDYPITWSPAREFAAVILLMTYPDSRIPGHFCEIPAAINHYDSTTYIRSQKGRPTTVMKCPTVCVGSMVATPGMDMNDLTGRGLPIATRCGRPGYSVLKCPYSAGLVFN